MVIQELRRAITSGSPTSPLTASLVRTRASEEAPAAQPASAIAHRTPGPGAVLTALSVLGPSSGEIVMAAPFSSARFPLLDGTSQARPLMRVAQRTRMKGGVCEREYSLGPHNIQQGELEQGFNVTYQADHTSAE